MSHPDKVDENDIALFRKSVGSVQPIRQDSVVSRSEKPITKPIKRVADERHADLNMTSTLPDQIRLKVGEELYFKRDGVQSRLFQKLKRGHLQIEDELDLHGMTIALAEQALFQFLAKACAGSCRCIHIIHGKGNGSKNGIPILKAKLKYWLRQHSGVLAFCPSRQHHGGTGAVYVLMKKYSDSV